MQGFAEEEPSHQRGRQRALGIFREYTERVLLRVGGLLWEEGAPPRSFYEASDQARTEHYRTSVLHRHKIPETNAKIYQK